MECTDAHGCTLESADIVDRVAAWRAVSSQAISREVDRARITSVYPADPQLVARVRELIAAEADCCSFLVFSIREESNQMVVQLTFPEQARALVEAVIAPPSNTP